MVLVLELSCLRLIRVRKFRLFGPELACQAASHQLSCKRDADRRFHPIPGDTRHPRLPTKAAHGCSRCCWWFQIYCYLFWGCCRNPVNGPPSSASSGATSGEEEEENASTITKWIQVDFDELVWFKIHNDTATLDGIAFHLDRIHS